MALMKLHQIPDSEICNPKQVPITSLEMIRAARMENLFSDFVKEENIQSDSAILMVPLEDGPLGAIRTIHKITKDIKHFSDVIPLYLNYADDYSQARVFCKKRNEKQLQSNRSLPLSLTYEGGRGEFLLNSIEALADLNKSKNQIAANVRIQTARLPRIQTHLELFEKIDRIDFGYRENSTEMYTSDVPHRFPACWDVGTEIAEENKTNALIKEFLFNIQGRFPESPLRSTEIIRAHIFGLVLAHKEKGIKCKRLLNILDPVYEKLPFLNFEEIEYRNDVTMSIIHIMTADNILQMQSITDGQLIKPGSKWESKKNIIDSYTNFYDQRFDIPWLKL